MAETNYIPMLAGGLVTTNSLGIGASTISNGMPSLATVPVAVPNPSEVVNTSADITVITTAQNNQIDLIQSPDSTQTIASIPYPIYNPSNFGVVESQSNNGYISYAGTNIQALLEIGDNQSGAARFAKQLIELTTISISTHRAKSPASALGFIGAKGYARGRRTIAGTMVFTQFTRDILMEFLNSELVSDLSKDTNYVKIDQLPLFNLTLLFTSEYGYMSYSRLYGIDFVTSGLIYSTNDLMTEQTISYVASDFTPLTQVDGNNFYTLLQTNNTLNPASSSELSPLKVISAQNKI